MDKLSIPLYFFNTFYEGSRHPQSGKCDGLEKGANCQYFVYEILRYFGYQVEDLRSSELWEDASFSKVVENIEPLDIVFFNKTNESYGAHIGICIGENRFLHLSKEIEYPTVWDMDEFLKRDIYKVYIGAKRVSVRTSH